jgi:hypothetical protein
MRKVFTFLTFIIAFLFSFQGQATHLNSYVNNSELQSNQQEVITNPYREDGFGAQFQAIIYYAIYAELNDKKFVYTPFSIMEHNYNNDEAFLHEKEELINFIENFEVSHDMGFQKKFLDFQTSYYHFFENNLVSCSRSHTLKKIKAIFRENKLRQDYLDPESFNIVVHIRRPNPHDSRIEGADTPNEVYLKVIDELRNTYKAKQPIFHLHSQGNINNFESIFNANDITLHLNESPEMTFCSMVFADVLVLSKSSFSYTAGILSEGSVYYMPFWHPPFPNWNIINEKS